MLKVNLFINICDIFRMTGLYSGDVDTTEILS